MTTPRGWRHKGAEHGSNGTGYRRAPLRGVTSQAGMRLQGDCDWCAGSWAPHRRRAGGPRAGSTARPFASTCRRSCCSTISPRCLPRLRRRLQHRCEVDCRRVVTASRLSAFGLRSAPAKIVASRPGNTGIVGCTSPRPSNCREAAGRDPEAAEVRHRSSLQAKSGVTFGPRKWLT
jgi:hypothetical protein